MLSLALPLLALLAGSNVNAAPLGVHLRSIIKYDGEVRQGGYIVKYLDGTTKPVFSSGNATFGPNSIDDVTVQGMLGAGASIDYNWNPEFFNGLAGTFDTDALNLLRSDPNVDYIAQDGVMRLNAIIEQTTAPWGLSRLSQQGEVQNKNARALTNTYAFDDTAGEGVDVYILDSGIRTTHDQFEGRASLGAVFGSAQNVDGNGHGTHVAGTVAGKDFGVAKKANVIAVKVVADDGAGSNSDIISGLQFALQSAQASGRPSIVSMSLGGPANRATDAAVTILTENGIHVVVAAGNENVDAEGTSPARAPAVITVGATDINDQRASFSNFGAAVDVFAPGDLITSSFNDDDFATNTISGTSMACPHISGVVALLIGKNGNQTPAQMSDTIKGLASNGIIGGVPRNTANVLANIEDA